MLNRSPRPAGALATLAAALALGACQQDPAPRPPVVVIGVDGMEWSVVEPLLREGSMPNLARLIEHGVAGSLASMKPTFSPMLWTTIVTGRMPQDHGIPFFSEVDPASGMPKEGGLPYTSECRRVPALWNLADAAGLSTTAVAWWISWPAEHLQRGRVVSSYAAQAQGALMWKAGVWADGLPELTWPVELAKELAPRLRAGSPTGPVVQEQRARYGTFPTDSIASERQRALTDVRQRNFLASWTSDRVHARIFCDLLEREVSDLNLVYFGATDVVGHMFWKYHEPSAYEFQIPADQVEFFGQHVRKACQDVDVWLGEILARLPEERVVVLVSDHGMRAFYKNDPLSLQNGHHQEGEAGVFVLSGTGVMQRGLLGAEQRLLGDLRDVAPLVSDLLGIAALREMQPNSLRGLMDAAWQTAHPEAARVPSPPFRAPMPPREPVANASAIFTEQFSQLGYSGVGGSEPPR